MCTKFRCTRYKDKGKSATLFTLGIYSQYYIYGRLFMKWCWNELSIKEIDINVILYYSPFHNKNLDSKAIQSLWKVWNIACKITKSYLPIEILRTTESYLGNIISWLNVFSWSGNLLYSMHKYIYVNIYLYLSICLST